MCDQHVETLDHLFSFNVREQQKYGVLCDGQYVYEPLIYRGAVAVTVILTWTICIIIDEEPCLRSNSKVTLEVDE